MQKPEDNAAKTCKSPLVAALDAELNAWATLGRTILALCDEFNEAERQNQANDHQKGAERLND